jgi:hypothetical protein
MNILELIKKELVGKQIRICVYKQALKDLGYTDN